MARWRLTASHYINLKPGTEWQQVETDRDTGVQARHTYSVPKLLDIQDGKCYNDRDGIIVSDGIEAQPRDYIFIGEPTPDMEPLDDSARAISAQFASKWRHPIESLPSQGFSETLISDFQKQVEKLVSLGKGEASTPVSGAGVDPSEFKALQEQVASLMARNAELEAKPKASAPQARRA